MPSFPPERGSLGYSLQSGLLDIEPHPPSALLSAVSPTCSQHDSHHWSFTMVLVQRVDSGSLITQAMMLWTEKAISRHLDENQTPGCSLLSQAKCQALTLGSHFSDLHKCYCQRFTSCPSNEGGCVSLVHISLVPRDVDNFISFGRCLLTVQPGPQYWEFSMEQRPQEVCWFPPELPPTG